MMVGLHIVRWSLALAAVVLGVCPLADLRADDMVKRPKSLIADEPAWVTSPYHGVTDGNGRVIPCRCRYQEREYRLGEVVCMSTHLGVVMTRCDLMLNNTSWVPTETPCTMSHAKPMQDLVARR